MRSKMKRGQVEAAAVEAPTRAAKRQKVSKHRKLSVLDLPQDVLVKVYDLVGENDRFAFALSCKDFRAAQQARRGVALSTSMKDVMRGVFSGDIRLTKGWLRWAYGLITRNRRDNTRQQILKLAAFYGYNDVLEWLQGRGCPMYRQCPKTCYGAALNGHLHTLVWLKSQRCRWDRRTCSSAALGGHLEVLQWLRKNGCPWDSTTCLSAAEKGHLRVLKWAREEGGCPCPRSIGYELTDLAAAEGHVETLKYLRRTGCPWDESTAETAAEGGHTSVLEYMRSEIPPCPFDKRSTSRAACNGHLGTLQWLRREGCAMDPMVCDVAARCGHLEILKVRPFPSFFLSLLSLLFSPDLA